MKCIHKIFYNIVIVLIVCSCSTSPTKYIISEIDLKSKNVDHIREGLEYVLGRDSAGIAAMNYINDYEEKLEKLYPIDKSIVGKPDPLPGPDYRLVAYFNRPHVIEQLKDNPSWRIFMNYINQMKLSSIILLNKSYEVCISTRNPDDAKMGVAAGYVAIASDPKAGELESIAKKVYYLLKELYAKNKDNN